MNYGGVHWLGLPPMGKLYSFKSEWNDVTKTLSSPSAPNEKTEKEIDFGFLAREKMIASFSAMKNYGFCVKNNETGRGTIAPTTLGTTNQQRPNMVAIDLYIFSSIVIVNARQAFTTLNWMQGVNTAIREVCTAYCGKYNTDNLGEDGGAELLKLLWLKNPEILKLYGVAFYHLSYNGWDYSGTPAEKAEIYASSRKAWNAKNTADASRKATDAAIYDIEEKGKAKATAITAEGNAEAAIIAAKGVAINAALKGTVDSVNGINPKVAEAIINGKALKDATEGLRPGATLSLGGNMSILAQPGKEGK